VVVDDPLDDRLAPYRDLTDAALRRSLEAADGIFVVEGRLAVEQLLASPYPVRSLLVTTERAGAVAPLVASVRAAGGEVLVAPRSVVAATVGFDLHRGVVAVAGRRPPVDVGEVLDGVVGAAAAPVVVVAEGVNDPENLGSLFRNVAALGALAVLLDPTCADPLYRRVVRVSMGHALRVPTARFVAWPDDLALLRRAGLTLVALTPDRAAVPLGRCVGGRPLALMVGAEGPGLSEAALAAADERVRIEISDGVDSLNVATAAAIALHHVRHGGAS
jgi:tRNA G18 (ribose-2'-O)-methylase SpoU